MKFKAFGENGQALIIITLVAIGLFGIVGLAVDGSAKYSDRRHAQNAADTAALAGSLALVDSATESNWEMIARDRATTNGYAGDLVHNQVWVYKCSVAKTDPKRDTVPNNIDCGTTYEGNSSYAQVVIKSQVNTYFARVLGIQKTQNIVNAVTYWQPRGENYDGNLLVALNPNPCSGGGADGNITLGTAGGSGGEALINLDGGGAYVNSDGSCGMNLIGCPTITVTDGDLGSTGSGNINLENSSQACTDKLLMPTPVFDQDPYPFPPKMPDVPAECSGSLGTWENIGSISYLNPGKYYEFPPKKTQAQPRYDHMVLRPGTYCVDDTIKLVTEDIILEGTDVTLFITQGHKFSFEGGTIDLTAPTEGDYAGYVIIVDSSFSGSPLDCKIDGNTGNNFTGTIFAPYCNLTINGGSTPTSYNAQIIAYTIKLTGSSTVNLYYDESVNAQSQAELGLMR